MSQAARASNSTFVDYVIPRQPAFLAAVGEVALLQSQLDRALRLTIKSVANIDLPQALVSTKFDGSASLRRRIDKAAKKRLGKGIALRRLRALLKRCRRATEKRNELVHAVWFRNIGSKTIKRTDGRTTKHRPSVTQVRSLAKQLDRLAEELNAAPHEGISSRGPGKEQVARSAINPSRVDA